MLETPDRLDTIPPSPHLLHAPKIRDSKDRNRLESNEMAIIRRFIDLTCAIVHPKLGSKPADAKQEQIRANLRR
jgi:hypothetical protein